MADRGGRPLDRRQQHEEHVLPSHRAHHAGQQSERRPLPGRPSPPSRRPEPREDRDGRHRRRVRHRRFFHEIPEDERAKRHDRCGQCCPSFGRVDPRQAIAEEQADQAPEQPGDADRLPVRIRRAVGGNSMPARGKRVGDPVADGEKRGPRQAGADRPGRLGMAGRRGRKQVRLVAEPEQAIVVGKIVVAVEPQRSQVCEVVEAVTLQTRAEPKLRDHPGREGEQEHRRDRAIGAPRAGRMHGPQRGRGGDAGDDEHARWLERHANPVQPRCPRHGSSRQVDATKGDQHERASDRQAASDHR